MGLSKENWSEEAKKRLAKRIFEKTSTRKRTYKAVKKTVPYQIENDPNTYDFPRY
jgi:hypothetical protein